MIYSRSSHLLQKKYNLTVRIVTNAHWASNLEVATIFVNKLVHAGLKEINFSTGDEHLQFVPIKNIQNAIMASITAGLTPLVNIETKTGNAFTSKYFLQQKDFRTLIGKGKLQILNGVWIDFSNNENLNEDNHNKKKITFSKKKCDSLFNGINIDPCHRLLACCGITSKRTKYLDLGSLKSHSIKDLYNKQYNDFLKIWIATEGPHKILDFLSIHTDIDTEKFKSIHACQICSLLFNNKQYLNLLKEKHQEVYTNIILKYLFTK